MGQTILKNGMWIHFQIRSAIKLSPILVDCVLSRTRYRLVRGNNKPFDPPSSMQRGPRRAEVFWTREELKALVLHGLHAVTPNPASKEEILHQESVPAHRIAAWPFVWCQIWKKWKTNLGKQRITPLAGLIYCAM